LMSMLTSACPSTSRTCLTFPTSTPWILTSDFSCSPWPAAVKSATSRYFGDSAPFAALIPKNTAASPRITATSPVITRKLRSLIRPARMPKGWPFARPAPSSLRRLPSQPQHSGDLHGVAAAPEDQRQDEVDEHD